MKNRALTHTVILGALSASLYFLLWLFEEQLIHYTQQGRWYFIIPIAIAFAFSLVHGTFTGYFWDVLGFKAKTKGK